MEVDAAPTISPARNTEPVMRIRSSALAVGPSLAPGGRRVVHRVHFDRISAGTSSMACSGGTERGLLT